MLIDYVHTFIQYTNAMILLLVCVYKNIKMFEIQKKNIFRLITPFIQHLECVLYF